VVELDSVGLEKYAIRTEVIEMVSHETIPAVWIGGVFVGGLEEVEELENKGLLDGLLESAEAGNLSASS
jgi:glutaredoxin-related protein